MDIMQSPQSERLEQACESVTILYVWFAVET